MKEQLTTKTKIEFVRGTIKDLNDIVAANEAIFTNVYDVEPYTLEDYQTKLARKRPLILICRDNNRIVGDSIAYPEDHAFTIWVLGVREEYRRQGFATKLFELNEQYAKDHSYSSVTTVVFSASDGMLKLVKKLGYSVIKFHNSKICRHSGEFYYKLRKQLQ